MSLDQRIYCDLCHDREIFNPIYRMNPQFRLCVECAREITNLYIFDFEVRWMDSDFEEKYGPASKIKVRETLPQIIREAIFVRDGRICKHCGCSDNLTIDHIHPVAHGGTDELENLQVLCRSCNSKKGTNIQSEDKP